MKLLALDTSAQCCSLALLQNDKIVSLNKVAPMQQAQIVLPMINDFLKENNLELNQLDALVLGCGPGSFTGVRIASSVIQGLALGIDLPVILVSSLAAIAQNSYTKHGWKNIMVAVDARVEEVYCGAYQIDSMGVVYLQASEQVIMPRNMVLPKQNTWHGAGNAWDIYAREINCRPIAIDPLVQPLAEGLLPQARQKFTQGAWVPAFAAIPVYLRDNVAKKQ
ncbi:hypothetical protein AYO45_04345 [Gammaproteobacteria bacterium SCGC AG-212-F23]|nr:hypothetical protein AYO45_04345 [Gammaproteobacteria bacterium SCGC AG-212-F23]